MILAAAATQLPCYAQIASYYRAHHERGPFHTKVFTDGDYALVSWYGTHSGGEGLFRRRGAQWCLLVNGGGALDVDESVRYGVPRATAKRLIARRQRSFQ